jgi:hypothetical protein
MAESYFINQQPLTSQTKKLYILNWDDVTTSSRGFSVSPDLKRICLAQKGSEAANLFDNDFVNYTSGYILCVNTPVNINSVLGSSLSSPSAASIVGSLVFTVVRMPKEFIGNEASLSSKYLYGEELMVYFSFELNNFVSQVPNSFTPVANPASFPQALSQTIVARDMNIKGRAVKGTSTSSGGGIGVWS